MVHRVRIGTSGWMYKDWGEKFYPPELKSGHLSYLSHEFDTVEINSSFYHLPKPTTFTKWRGETGDEFAFSVKISRYITHRKKLVDTRKSLELFLRNAKRLEEKFAVVLIQLPPSLKYDEDKLSKFLKDLQGAIKSVGVTTRFALEPRHETFIQQADAVRSLLRAHNIALVFPHSAAIPSFEPEKENITADFVYVRFHGPSEFAASRYGKKLLQPWAKKIKEWSKSLDIFVYFNNDVHGHAIEDARVLKKLVGVKPQKLHTSGTLFSA